MFLNCLNFNELLEQRCIRNKTINFFQEITDNELSAICDESVPKIVSVFQLNRIVRKEAEAETSSVERFGFFFTFFGCVSTTEEKFHFSRMFSCF